MKHHKTELEFLKAYDEFTFIEALKCNGKDSPKDFLKENTLANEPLGKKCNGVMIFRITYHDNASIFQCSKCNYTDITEKASDLEPHFITPKT